MKKITKVVKKHLELIDELYNSGIALFHNHRYEEAIADFKKALNINPNLLHAYNYIGNALQERKQFDEAITYYKKAILINPDDPTAYINLGILYQNIKQYDESIQYFKKVIDHHPDFAIAYDYMGLSLANQGRIEQAYESYQASLRFNPNSIMSLVNIGNLTSGQGHWEVAEGFYKRAMRADPSRSEPYSAFLMHMLYSACYDTQTIYSEHCLFADMFAKHLSVNIKVHSNEHAVNRKLRIGYVSPNFNRHPVAFFIEPILAFHSRDKFEVFCYSDVQIPDEITERIISSADHWRNIDNMSDENADALIRTDKIDILIDLAGHTANNRLLIFARKPAPIQLTWIGYPATTGLQTIDYKIVDHYTDPPGTTEQFYSEKLMRLPNSFVCYLPDEDSPDVGTLPAAEVGHITFGSFNFIAKITPEVFTVWAKILNKLPDSRLLLKDRNFDDKTAREYAMNMFKGRGIGMDRIILNPWDSPPRHMEAYNSVDIGLDTFPYNGLTTTCEAMWMGVPVISLAGTAYASRAGVSLLSNVGLKELIANTPDEYIEIAVNLAKDLKKVQSLREKLRDMMMRSPLCDEKRFTANLEICYRGIWKTWCEST